MARRQKKTDVVIVGLGWTGSILGIELANAGLKVLALERGADRDMIQNLAYPKMIDELKYGVRHGLMLRPADSTVTIRHSLRDTALPYRSLGSFLPGNGVGGAGVHWNGHTWRALPEELRLKTYVLEKFGASVIPAGMTIEDWGVTYEELEPHFERFEYVCGISGRAGNLGGSTQAGGNPFEGPRKRDYPLPPLPTLLNGKIFGDAAKAMGYHPFPLPAANLSDAYTNEYGMQLGPCNFCGFCERFGCIGYSKSSPQTCILGALKRKSNFSYQTRSEVLRVELASDRRTATGVTYIDEKGEEIFQPADLVILAAYQFHNVHLLLLSGIGRPYVAETGEGVVGKNYAYQMTGGTSLFFKDLNFNPFVGAGSSAMVIDNFSVGQIDFGKEGFIGGSYISSGQFNGQPIRSMALPSGTPTWGAGWKKGIRDWYGHSMSIGSHGSNMSYRDCYLDLDPTYRNKHGQPMLRMTFDWKPNDIRMTQFMRSKVESIAKFLNPTSWVSGYKGDSSHYDVRPYQTTHTVGGAIMGIDPTKSAVNRYLQTWDVHNVFVMGASAFPQNLQYNPTGTVGALAYWSAHAIKHDYLRNPRPLA
ncbi:gluconate 2-dehydrogenase alpha chain [Bradyrhizobium huanghuaihaiense]|uniref:Gluconate 2-dehydrogenase alpha chain n=1 Tax=Bradyrhizobium huanghuaihaiense TaxID=990078 RepID=A0A562R3X9_9BRAD|nr:GMC family oxidoreductase [Bradyrhizobium huanghuaihaiense]TWI63792.1 gluconate 2-dehydrogenase alpha chain [Bradyrhizobium huanghuaihaiense]